MGEAAGWLTAHRCRGRQQGPHLRLQPRRPSGGRARWRRQFSAQLGRGAAFHAYGLHIDTDDNLYCTEDGDHTVRKCSTEGKVLLMIGVPEEPSPFMSGDPSHRCTHTALSRKGEIYVSDGYGNARVQR